MKNRMKELRARHDLTQEELADKAGVVRQTIGLIEKGDIIPGGENMIKLAKALQVPVEELFYEDEETE